MIILELASGSNVIRVYRPIEVRELCNSLPKYVNFKSNTIRSGNAFDRALNTTDVYLVAADVWSDHCIHAYVYCTGTRDAHYPFTTFALCRSYFVNETTFLDCFCRMLVASLYWRTNAECRGISLTSINHHFVSLFKLFETKKSGPLRYLNYSKCNIYVPSNLINRNANDTARLNERIRSSEQCTKIIKFETVSNEEKNIFNATYII